MPTLEQRRDHADLIQVYKILHRIDNVEKEQWFEIQEGERITRGQQGKLKLKSQRARLDLRNNFFSHRVVSKWNNLPEEMRDCASIKMFKNALRALQSTGGAGP